MGLSVRMYFGFFVDDREAQLRLHEDCGKS